MNNDDILDILNKAQELEKKFVELRRLV